jgi:hypothetical protein
MKKNAARIVLAVLTASIVLLPALSGSRERVRAS